jgi:hypothetical protein
VPPLQVEPPVQTVQLVPQWAESVAELHAPSEHVVEPAGHIEAHAPLLQTWGDGHMAQLVPQCVVSDATHAPPQETSPDAHTHDPAWHVVPVPQVVPQVPQFWLSLVTSTHALAQIVWPATHVGPVEPPPPVPPPPPSEGPKPWPPEVPQLTTTRSVEQTTAIIARTEER